MTVYTVGHGVRPVEELISTLHEAAVGTLVDVRRFPGSRRNPQFNQADLSEALSVVHLLGPGRHEAHRLYEESEVRDGRLYLCGTEVA